MEREALVRVSPSMVGVRGEAALVGGGGRHGGSPVTLRSLPSKGELPSASGHLLLTPTLRSQLHWPPRRHSPGLMPPRPRPHGTGPRAACRAALPPPGPQARRCSMSRCPTHSQVTPGPWDLPSMRGGGLLASTPGLHPRPAREEHPTDTTKACFSGSPRPRSRSGRQQEEPRVPAPTC